MHRLLREKVQSGWLAWPDTVEAYILPSESASPIQSWDKSNAEAVESIRELATDPSFWQKLVKHYSAENHSEVIVQDDASCVKSICSLFLIFSLFFLLIWKHTVQLLEDEPFEALRPTLEELLEDSDKNKQRGAAELLAGILSGKYDWHKA